MAGSNQESLPHLWFVHVAMAKPNVELMSTQGASGAGKTTLLNVLAERTTIGVVGGDILVDTNYQNIAFARKIGYAQQDDIHLPTASVREALTFSALLRQPSHYKTIEKLDYVNQVIELLDMVPFQHSVIDRLNIEQKKRVTIGTELAARPELLLFLDEPTSGLDSDSSYSICTLLRRLADNGQAILCTIHQPSSPLLMLFDRLLFLQEGSVLYFGDFGPEFRTLIEYFEQHGCRTCEPWENPAEWMLEVTSQDDGVNWANTWKESKQFDVVKRECELARERLSKTTSTYGVDDRTTEFATSFWYQLGIVTKRTFQHDWRSPTYLYSKSMTTFGCVSALFYF
jgi:ATP-binding cassette subfamily G (WHITE) protein 2 (PDR)